MQLNKSRTYCQIIGHPEAAYEQDGVLFDGRGRPIDEKTGTKTVEKLEQVQTNQGVPQIVPHGTLSLNKRVTPPFTPRR